MLSRQTKRIIRHLRVRAKIKGTAKVPRFCVFRSSQHIYCQLIDDEKGKVLAFSNDFGLKLKEKGKIAKAQEVGKNIAEKAKKKNITKVVFDRGGFQYHGRVKALAESARTAGLKF